MNTFLTILNNGPEILMYVEAALLIFIAVALLCVFLQVLFSNLGRMSKWVFWATGVSFGGWVYLIIAAGIVKTFPVIGLIVVTLVTCLLSIKSK